MNPNAKSELAGITLRPLAPADLEAVVAIDARLAGRARRMAEAVGLKSTVLGEAAMRELGMNILLAVSKGSANEAQFLILEHAPAGHEDEQPLVFAGKGITFDTGGISLKAGDEMWRRPLPRCRRPDP